MKETVVIVPGMLTSSLEMSLLRSRLPFDCYSINYDTISTPIHESGLYLREVIRSIPGVVHVVAFSMGGLVALHAYADGDMPSGRVVLLGTPVLGSSKARVERECPTGFILRQTWHRGFDGDVPYWDHRRDIGIVGGLHDDTVPANETRLPRAKRILLPVTHSQMLSDAAVAREVESFLTRGAWSGQSGVSLAPERRECNPITETHTHAQAGLLALSRVLFGVFASLSMVAFLGGKPCQNNRKLASQKSWRFRAWRIAERWCDVWRVWWSWLAGLAWKLSRRICLASRR